MASFDRKAPPVRNHLNGRKLRRYDHLRTPRELTFSCYRRLPLLRNDRTRQWFVEALEETRREWPIELWAYVIMPEHVHLLVMPRELGLKVGKFAGEVKEKVARKAISWLEVHAPHWLQHLTVVNKNETRRRFWMPGGGYDRNIDNLRTLQLALNYFHLNPVRRGLVERPEDWYWSSAGWYAGLTPVALEMDRTLPMICQPTGCSF